MNVKISVIGMGALKARLEKLKGNLKNPQVPLMQSAIQVQEETFRNFVDSGRPEAWQPLSMMTQFIRAHRADGPKRTDGKILQDTRRLMNSFLPFIGDDGKTFGVGTNVEYAILMQNGGMTEKQTILISGFTRRMPLSAIARSLGERRITKSGKDKRTVKVKDYKLHLQGGAPIPARPFFPRNISELSSWGYQAKIKNIFSKYFSQNI